MKAETLIVNLNAQSCIAVLDDIASVVGMEGKHDAVQLLIVQINAYYENDKVPFQNDQARKLYDLYVSFCNELDCM